ncbi:hypothetical protein BD324DRAFT_648057 [Kockovaella imperatae]|uniref:SnoaL-like domain-containing protein n=1 Tax=Kockovaella imperatae TaxID=4999 RepID=A0A1Y1UU56_9TREE|nr:hypothetical protein BD324DRAFT_648057 [Kockovaella imperatae]ORX41167.1 hypothetical protein BD324DRAFT_648057 [Kockovaella imperatae]
MPLDVEGVRELFAPLTKADWPGFMTRVRDDVSWTVGNGVIHSFPVAGTHNKEAFLKAFKPLSECFDDPIPMNVTNIIPYPDGSGAAVELTVKVKAKDGSPFDNFYCWVTEFDDASPPKVKTVRAYLDTALVKSVMEKNGHGE